MLRRASPEDNAMSRYRMLMVVASCAIFAAQAAYAGTVNYEITPIAGGLPGQPIYQYTYFLSDFNFASQQELDIVFPANLFGTLSRGVVTPGFDLILFQPNNPLGTEGDFSALADSAVTGLTATWSVDAVYLG